MAIRLLVISLSILAALQVNAKGCVEEALESLKMLKKAQSSVQSSLISNHEFMASTFESYAEDLIFSRGSAYKPVTQKMSSSIETLRQRKDKAVVISNKLDLGTQEIIDQLETCIK